MEPSCTDGGWGAIPGTPSGAGGAEQELLGAAVSDGRDGGGGTGVVARVRAGRGAAGR